MSVSKISNFITNKTVFSWSMFESYSQCPLRFYYVYGLNKKEPSSAIALGGCALHVFLELIYKRHFFRPCYAWWPSVLQKEYEIDWKQYQYKFIKQIEVDKLKGWGYGLIKKFYNLAKKEELLRPALLVEKGFKGKYKNHTFKIKLDLGLELPKYGFTLLDWKSGQEDIKSIYQLVWYAALVRKKLNKEVDTIAPVYLSKEKIVYTPITEALRAVVGDYIGAIYSSILEDTKFLPKKNKYCNYCTLRGGVCNLDQ